MLWCINLVERVLVESKLRVMSLLWDKKQSSGFDDGLDRASSVLDVTDKRTR